MNLNHADKTWVRGGWVLIYPTRVLLVLVLLFYICTLMRILALFLRGGILRIEQWVAHIALEGKFGDTTPAAWATWLRQAYIMLGTMLFVMPPALHLLQRWMPQDFSGRIRALNSPSPMRGHFR